MPRTKSRTSPNLTSISSWWKDGQDKLNRRGKYAPNANNDTKPSSSNNDAPIQGPQNKTFVPFKSEEDKRKNKEEVAALKQKKKNNNKTNKSNKPVSNTNTTKKGGVSKEELARQKKIIERKNPKLEKLRSQLGHGKNKSSSDITVPDLVSKSKPKKEILTRQQQRRQKRDEKKANRRVGRTAKNYVKDGGNLDNFDQEGSKQAELAKIAKRREGRNQYLRNFASQLTRGVNAPSRKDFDNNKSDHKFFNNQKNKAAAIEKEASKEMNKYVIDGTFGADTDETNSGMQDSLFGDWKKNLTWQGGNNAFTGSSDRSSITSNLEDESKKKGYRGDGGGGM